MTKMRAGRTMTARVYSQRLSDAEQGVPLTDLREYEREEVEDEAEVQDLVWRCPRQREDDVLLLLRLVRLIRRGCHGLLVLRASEATEGERRRAGPAKTAKSLRLPTCLIAQASP